MIPFQGLRRYEQKRSLRINPITLNCDLDLESAYRQVMDSAHCLTEIKIWMKFIENRLKGAGDMEHCQIQRVKHITLNCDLDIESV